MNNILFRNFYALTSSPYELNNKKHRERILKASEEHDFSHYFVCEYNRLIIKKDSIKWNPHAISFIFMKQISTTEWEEFPFAIKNNFYGTPVSMNIEDNNIILTSLINGNSEVFFNVYTFIEFLNSLSDLEEYFKNILQYKLTVRYIGQTKLTDDYFRFKNHEKISEISNYILEYKPQMQVLVIFYNFKMQQSIISDLDFLEKNEKINSIPKDVKKNIVEAALIKYFKPSLNDKFTNSFPSNKHTSYDYFYKNGLANITIEFRNEYRAYILGNETIPYSKSKMINFELIKNDSEYNLFNKLEHTDDLDSFVKIMT